MLTLLNEQFRIVKETVKTEYNDRPREPKIVADVDRWSLFRGFFVL
jgi:hypothetical protein